MKIISFLHSDCGKEKTIAIPIAIPTPTPKENSEKTKLETVFNTGYQTKNYYHNKKAAIHDIPCN